MVGILNKSRTWHNVIYDGNYALVVGGEGMFKTEKCWFTTEGMNCSEQEPSLNMYQNPGLFLVSSNYCVKNPHN